MLEIKTILLPFNNHCPTEIVVDAARQILISFGGYIEGAYYRPLMPIIAAEGITLPGDFLAEFEQEGQFHAGKALFTFKSLLEQHGIAFGSLDDAVVGLCAGWSEIVGSSPSGIGEYARLFDLSIVARRGSFEAWKAIVEAILFESGRPLLLIGSELPDSIGQRIMVAWNCSTEAARSLIVAAPFFKGSEKIVVVEVDGGTVTGPNAKEVARHLSQKGLSAISETIQCDNGKVGRTLLKFSESWGSDLIVKGAYTHSRLRQLIFGGATREIIEESRVPILLCH